MGTSFISLTEHAYRFLCSHPNPTMQELMDSRIEWFLENTKLTKKEIARSLIVSHIQDVVGEGDTIEQREGCTELDKDMVRILLNIAVSDD